MKYTAIFLLLLLTAPASAEVWHGFSGVLAQSGSGGVSAVSGSGGAHASAPFGNFVPLLDYARSLAYWTTTTNTGLNPVVGALTQAQAQAWLGQRVIFGEDERGGGVGGTNSNNKDGMLLGGNPRLKFWAYTIDQTCIVGVGGVTGCVGAPWVEDDFLHTGFPHTSGNRVTATIFSSSRYLMNVTSATTRQNVANNILNIATVTTSNQFIWLDEHGYTIQAIVDGGGSTVIDEYGGAAVSTLQDAWEADLTTMVGTIYNTLHARGVGLIVNQAQSATQSSNPNFFGEYTSNPGVGMTTEVAWQVDQMKNGGSQWMGWWIFVINTVAQGGGTVDTLANQSFNGYAGLVGNLTNGGNYLTALERGIMWRLAAYWIVYQPNVYFDLNMDFSVTDPIANQWWPAYAYGNLGQPSALPVYTDYIEDASFNNTCTSQNFWHPQIWHRAFPNGHVYVRPKDGYDCGDPDGNAVTITLSQPMKLLKGDGTFGAPQSTLSLKMQEGAIMVIN